MIKAWGFQSCCLNGCSQVGTELSGLAWAGEAVAMVVAAIVDVNEVTATITSRYRKIKFFILRLMLFN